jgi:type IX secretion system PorP/SprF family membrane protein
MKKLILYIFFILSTEGVLAQQEGQQSLFMFNTLAINPGVAGSRNAPSITLAHRSQWVGFKGAPTQQTLSFHSPIFSQRLGFGTTIFNREIGMFNFQNASFALAYSVIKTTDFSIRVGMQGSARRFAIRPEDVNAVNILTTERLNFNDIKTRYFGNFGAGLFVNYKDCFLGASVPFYYPNLTGVDPLTPVTAQDYPHYYVMGGLSFKIFGNVYAKPSGILKMTKNAPWNVELNCSMSFDDKVTAGVGVRGGKSNIEDLGESVMMLLFYHITDKWGIGTAYDYNVTRLGKYTKGSFELMTKFDMVKPALKFTNPRVFY